jgi:hypothetical protein
MASGVIKFSNIAHLLKQPWSLAFFFYCIFFTLTLCFNADPSGFFSIARQLLFFCGTIVFIAREPKPVTLYWSSIISLAILVIFMHYCAQLVGLNLFLAVLDFFGSGNFQHLTYKVLRAIFNAQHVGTVTESASVRNYLASGFALIFMTLLATKTSVYYPGKFTG